MNEFYYFIRNILLPPLLEGTLVTIKLIILSIPMCFILGVLIAVGRVYGNKIISTLCTVYVIFFVALLYWYSFLSFIMVYPLSVFSFLLLQLQLLALFFVVVPTIPNIYCLLYTSDA